MTRLLQTVPLSIALVAMACPAKEADDPTSTELPNGDLLIGDFESRDQGRVRAWGWQTEGDAFRHDYHTGARMLRARVGQMVGKGLLTSFTEGIGGEGSITSPAFTIERPTIEFLLSGGERAAELSVDLLVGDEVVRSASAGDDDRFEPVAFDVAEFVGSEARVRIVDRAEGIWSHINVDHIVQTASPRAARVISSAPTPEISQIGSLQTLASGTIHPGPFSIAGGKFVDGEGRAFSIDDTLVLSTGLPSPSRGAADTLILRNGERWIGKITGIQNDVVSFESAVMKRQELALPSIAALLFNGARYNDRVPGDPGTLYRTAGEPIPGKLVWIRDKDVAIDCPLGVIPIPRASLDRFVVRPGPEGVPTSGDELELADGSVVRGVVGIGEDRLKLDHPVVGELLFPIAAVARLRRNPEETHWLSQLRPIAFESSGPLLAPPRPEYVRLDGGEVRALRVHPRSMISYAVPDRGGPAPRFRCQLAPGPGNRGKVSVTASCGGEEFSTSLEPGAAPLPIDLPLESGATLKLTIDFPEGGQPRFPSSVDWREAHIVSAGGETPNPDGG